MSVRAQWTLIIAIVVACFAIPGAIYLGAVVAIPIVLLGVAVWAASMARLTGRDTVDRQVGTDR